jgi:ADP-heptose:LPS heptosyltransferase
MQRILVRRLGALGDVIDTTPVFRRLRREYPDAEIDVETHYPQVFLQNPNRIGIGKRPVEYDRFIDLDMAFENRLGQVSHPESYMEVAFGDRRDALALEFVFDPVDVPMDQSVDWSKVVVMHPARSWANRTLPRSFWKKVAVGLVESGWTVVVTGTLVDQLINVSGVIDARGRHSLAQQAALIHASRAFVCGASGLVNVGFCTDVPMVWLDTITLPWMSERERHGVKGWGCYPLPSPVECVGCYHSLGRPVTHFDCPLGTNACVHAFDPKAVVAQVNHAAGHMERWRACRLVPEKLNLADVTLVCIDTVCHELAGLAVRECLTKANFGDVQIYTDTTTKWPLLPSDVKWYPIEASSLDDVANILWRKVPWHIKTSHVLVIQWDSWILNPEAWSDDFLQYDYIGAPWGWHGDAHEVGNGGFSLRSRRLMEYVAAQGYAPTSPEDDHLCRSLRSTFLEEAGFKFAPVDVANRFSFERTGYAGKDKHFGFHGIFNFRLVLEGGALQQHSDLIHANAYLKDSAQLKEFDVLAANDRALAQGRGRNVRGAEYFEAAEAAVVAGNLQQALAGFDAGLLLDRQQPGAWAARGHVQYSLNQTFEALCSFEWSILYGLNTAENHSNRATCLLALGHPRAALEAVDEGLKINPKSIHAMFNKAMLVHFGRGHAESVALYDEILRTPDLPVEPWVNDSHHARSGPLLALGRFREGWADNEWRSENRQPFPRAAPKWDGKPVKRLVVVFEQGFGDHIQFIRFAPLLKSQGFAEEVYIEVRRPLARLARTMQGIDGVIEFGDKWPPDIDAATLLMSLPHWLEINDTVHIPPAPYLSADGTTWDQRLPKGFRVGLCWASGERPTDNRATHIQRRKSMQLKHFAPLAAVPGVTFVSLQVDGSAGQVIGNPGISVLDVSSAIDDFSDTADLMMALDLIITVDTAVAHLAGALGRPVWVMNRYDIDWRWLDNQRAAWYPTARSFAQQGWGDWGPVVREVLAALAQESGKRGQELNDAKMDLRRLGQGRQRASRASAGRCGGA